MHIIVEPEELFWEGWIVGQDAGRVVINFETISDGFNDNTGTGGVRKYPVKFGSWELVAEADVGQIEIGKQSFGGGDVVTLTKNPGEKFELRDVGLIVGGSMINGVTDEVEPGHAQALFVDGVIKQRSFRRGASRDEGRRGFGDVSDADDGVVRSERVGIAEMQREIAGNDDR